MSAKRWSPPEGSRDILEARWYLKVETKRSVKMLVVV
jgi:hypothetical protein